MRRLAKEDVELQRFVTLAKVIEIREMGRFLRRVFAFTLGASFVLLTLHSAGWIELPPVAINTVSYSIPAAVVGLLTTYLRAVFLEWKEGLI